MCGIVYVKRQAGKEAKKPLLKRYNKQKNRGQSGFGYCVIDNGVLRSVEKAETEKEITEKIEKETTSELLFHHRLPTSTPNFIESAHPIETNHPTLRYKYYTVHNGVITNAGTLKEKHENMGFKYVTEIKKKWITAINTYMQSGMFNDSESLAIELALFFEGKENKIGTRGDVAFITLQVEKVSNKAVKLFYGRNAGGFLFVK